MIREIYNTYEGGTNMKNRAFRIFAFTLAVMLIFVSYPTSASAAVECAHKNKTFDHYLYSLLKVIIGNIVGRGIYVQIAIMLLHFR